MERKKIFGTDEQFQVTRDIAREKAKEVLEECEIFAVFGSKDDETFCSVIFWPEEWREVLEGFVQQQINESMNDNPGGEQLH